MALVDYSSSSESEAATSPGKRKHDSASLGRSEKKAKKTESSALPPLPASFHDLYASTARLSTHDDPALHGGRRRAVPHVEGSWPSHVYLEWLPSDAEHQSLIKLLETLKSKTEEAAWNSLLSSPLSTTLPLHISLSSPLAIPGEQREAFIERLRRSLPALDQFTVKLSELDWVSNGDQTRWFLVLRCRQSAENELTTLLNWCNGICRKFGLDQLYAAITAPEKGKSMKADEGKKVAKQFRERAHKNRSLETPSKRDPIEDQFHSSIAWCLEPPNEPAGALVNRDIEVAMSGVRSIDVKMDSVKVKMGNVITSLDLGKRREDMKSILS